MKTLFLILVFAGFAAFNSNAQNNSVNEFDQIAKYDNNYNWTYKDGMKGLIDKDGKIVIPNIYEEITNFKDGFAWTYKDGKKGMIDLSGKVIIPNDYDEITSFKDGYAWTFKEGRKGKISNQGKIIVENEYDEILPYKDGLSWTFKDGLKGLIDQLGEDVLPNKFEDIIDLHNGTFKAIDDGKEMIIKFDTESGKDSGKVVIGKNGIHVTDQTGEVIINKDSLWVAEKKHRGGDTTKIKFKKGNILIISNNSGRPHRHHKDSLTIGMDFGDDFPFHTRKFHGNWSGFEMGMNNYLNNKLEFQLPQDGKLLDLNTGMSWQWNLNFMHKSFGIYKDRFGFVTGLGLAFNNYRFDSKVTFIPDSTPIKFFNDTTHQFKKNKLFISYLTLPLLLEYQIPFDHARIHIAAGFLASVKIYSRTKQIYDNDEEHIQNQDFHLFPFKFEATARLGYGAFNLFANYSLTQLFEKNKGPELYPLTVGLGLMF